MPYCGQCGREVKREIKFCPHCGAQLSKVQAQPPSLKTPQQLQAPSILQALKNIVKNKKIIVIPIIILVAISGLYLFAQWKFSITVSDVLLNMEFVDFRIENLTLDPPSATLVMTCSVENPSNNPIVVSIDYDIYLQKEYIASNTAENEYLTPKRKSRIDMQMPLGSMALEKIESLELDNTTYSVEGTFIAKSRVILIPVKVVKQFKIDW